MTDTKGLDAFLKLYEDATNSHDFNNVRPLLLPESVYFFSEQNLYGIDEIERAFTETFNSILDEKYTISDVNWIAVSDTVAVCTYKFHWVGYVDGKEKSGEGRGTNVCVKKDDKWHMMHEHLSSIK